MGGMNGRNRRNMGGMNAMAGMNEMGGSINNFPQPNHNQQLAANMMQNMMSMTMNGGMGMNKYGTTQNGNSDVFNNMHSNFVNHSQFTPSTITVAYSRPIDAQNTGDGGETCESAKENDKEQDFLDEDTASIYSILTNINLIIILVITNSNNVY